MAILSIKGADYCCIISKISKSQAINLMQDIDLIKKAQHYKTKTLLSYIKMITKILKLGDIEIEKISFNTIKALFLKTM